jgi:hypothetical protein
MRQNFVKAHQINLTATAETSATTESSTSAVDTAGYDSVTFLRSVSAAAVIKVEGGATSTSATTDLAGCSVTATAGALVKIEVVRSPYRYLRMTAESGVARVLGDCITILGQAKDKPVTNTTNSTAIVVATPTDA